MFTAMKGHVEGGKLLLQNGADIDARDNTVSKYCWLG
jgi:hypothetical protein